MPIDDLKNSLLGKEYITLWDGEDASHSSEYKLCVDQNIELKMSIEAHEGDDAHGSVLRVFLQDHSSTSGFVYLQNFPIVETAGTDGQEPVVIKAEEILNGPIHVMRCLVELKDVIKNDKDPSLSVTFFDPDVQPMPDLSESLDSGCPYGVSMLLNGFFVRVAVGRERLFLCRSGGGGLYEFRNTPLLPDNDQGWEERVAFFEAEIKRSRNMLAALEPSSPSLDM